MVILFQTHFFISFRYWRVSTIATPPPDSKRGDEDVYKRQLDDIMSKRKSEDINAFLFSVIQNKVVAGNDVFSYNQRPVSYTHLDVYKRQI